MRDFNETELDEFFSFIGTAKELEPTLYRWRKQKMPTNPPDHPAINLGNNFFKYGDGYSDSQPYTRTRKA